MRSLALALVLGVLCVACQHNEVVSPLLHPVRLSLAEEQYLKEFKVRIARRLTELLDRHHGRLEKRCDVVLECWISENGIISPIVVNSNDLPENYLKMIDDAFKGSSPFRPFPEPRVGLRENEHISMRITLLPEQSN